MNTININTKIKRKAGLIASDMDGETVMMNTITGKYYNLGKTGGAIWTIIEKAVIVDEIINQLTEKHQVDRNQCEQDVLLFLEQLYKSDLIEMVFPENQE